MHYNDCFIRMYVCDPHELYIVLLQERFAGPAPRGEGQRLRIRSGAVVAIFALNVSVSLSWLNITLHYTNAAARRIGHQHSCDYTGESSIYAALRRIIIQHRRGGRRT